MVQRGGATGEPSLLSDMNANRSVMSFFFFALYIKASFFLLLAVFYVCKSALRPHCRTNGFPPYQPFSFGVVLGESVFKGSEISGNPLFLGDSTTLDGMYTFSFLVYTYVMAFFPQFDVFFLCLSWICTFFIMIML